jgi:hypothetical protein
MEQLPPKPNASDKNEASATVMPEFELAAPLLSKTKVRRYLFALILSGPAVYFFLPRFAAMGHALQLIDDGPVTQPACDSRSARLCGRQGYYPPDRRSG